MISAIGDVLWIIFGGGVIIFIEYILGGLALCITVIGIPFGLQCFKIASLGLLPFGREVVVKHDHMGCLSLGMNVLWVIVFGLAIAITHLVLALYLVVTIIGIPFAVQHLKLARLAFLPFGSEIR
jgi:uncharacterized membrane protein YccF (DUF307 family)